MINGLLSETTRRGVYSDIDVVIAEMPGLIPAWEYLFEAYKLNENTELETMACFFRQRKNTSRIVRCSNNRKP